MVPKLARELASEHDGTPSFLAELQIGDARRGGHLHPRVSRGYGDLCSDVVRIIDMNNLEAEGTSRKRFPEPGQLLLFSCARTAPRRHRVVQEPERAAAARPTPVRGRHGSPRSCLAAGRRWGRRHRAAQRVSPKRSCLQNEATTVQSLRKPRKNQTQCSLRCVVGSGVCVGCCLGRMHRATPPRSSPTPPRCTRAAAPGRRCAGSRAGAAAASPRRAAPPAAG